MLATRTIRAVAGLALTAVLSSIAVAQVSVRGYTRKDGT